MSRSFLLRFLAAVPVFVCICLWIFSDFRGAYVRRFSPRGEDSLVICSGGIYFVSLPITMTGPVIWVSRIFPLEPRPDSAPFYYLGFNAGTIRSAPHLIYYFLRIPFWFPTALWLLVLWLIWQQTRPNPKLSAFPVQPLVHVR
ncbi:MAG: hypothetical protein FWD61_14675 [Phycisphaerales bacterium]|nr:hypothetical protein [Phycisphaerales bacterium]